MTTETLNNDVATQLAAMKAQLDALAAENEKLKASRTTPNFGEPVRLMKNGKIRCRHKTQLDINLLQALMLVVKAKDLIELCQKVRGGSVTRRAVYKKVQGENQRQEYDELWITSKDGKLKGLISTVSLAENADGTLDEDISSKANTDEYNDRMGRWHQLWKELEAKAGAKNGKPVDTKS